MFHGYQIYSLRFDPPNPKNLVFHCIRDEKVAFLCILITRRLILILFLPTTLFRCVGGVSQVS